MEEEINRRSFRRSLSAIEIIPKNKFGQTVIGVPRESESTDDKFEFSVDDIQGIKAQTSILNSAPQVLRNMLDALKDEPENDSRKAELIEQLALMEEDEKELPMRFTESDVILVLEEEKPENQFLKKIMEIKEEDSGEDFEDIQIPEYLQNKIQSMTKCCNLELNNTKCIKCNNVLPINAHFCPECGSSQIIKHCAECGFRFSDKEKFCPQCGTHR